MTVSQYVLGAQSSRHKVRDGKRSTALGQIGVGASGGGSASTTPPDGVKNLRPQPELHNGKNPDNLKQDVILLTCK